MKSQKQKGFTLLELMVAVGILAILMAIGVPSFQQSRKAKQIKFVAEDIDNMVSLARASAMSKNTTISICFSNDITDANAGITCDNLSTANLTSNKFSQTAGFVAYDNGASTAGFTGEANVISRIMLSELYPNTVQIGVPTSVAGNFFSFSRRGRLIDNNAGPIANVAFALEDDSGHSKRTTVIESSGRSYVCDPSATGAGVFCP